MSNTIWLTDRSRTLTDWKCPRARFHGYHAFGRGLVPPSDSLELFLGTALHDGLAAIATHWQQSGSADIDLISTTAGKAVFDTLMTQAGGDEDKAHFAKEQSILIEGLLRGFYRRAWTSLISQYPRIVSIEEEMTYPLLGGQDPTTGKSGVVFMSRPDIILADMEDNWVYVEYKSTSSKSENWVNQWGTAVQIHSTIKAVEHTLGKAPASVIVQGLYKGYKSYGRQNSPFCYAYYRQGTPPFSYPEYEYAYKQGFKRVPTWELESGLKGWVDNMPDQMLSDQFPQTPPIFVKTDQIERFFVQRLVREIEIQQSLNMIEGPEMPAEISSQFMDAFFPQHFDQCNPAGFSKPCDFRQLCHSGISDPLSMGWTLRTPHHQLELEQLNATVPNDPS